MPIAYQKLLGYMPDRPARTPGHVDSLVGFFPSSKGTLILGPDIPQSGGVNAPFKPLGAATVVNALGNVRKVVGTVTKLYYYDRTGPTYTDCSRAATVYTASETKPWSFTGFGAKMLANYKDTVAGRMQQIDIAAGGLFAYIANSPGSDIILTCGPASAQFVMALNYHDGVTDVPDGWYCSGLNDYTGWVTGTNQCAKGQLINNPGPITAGFAFRDAAIVFKENAMFIGEYVGPPVIWKWRKIAGDIGCIGKDAGVVVNDVLFWAARDGLYMYDGSYPRKIPGDIHNDWATNFLQFSGNGAVGGFADPAHRYHHKALYIPDKHLIGFGQPGVNYGSLPTKYNYWLWYNVQSGMWIYDQRFGSGTAGLPMYFFIDAQSAVGVSPYKTADMSFTGQLSSGLSAIWGFRVYTASPQQQSSDPHLFLLRGMRADWDVFEQAGNYDGATYTMNADAYVADGRQYVAGSAQTVRTLVDPSFHTDINDGNWLDYSARSVSGFEFSGYVFFGQNTNVWKAELRGILFDFVSHGKVKGG